MRTGRDRFRIRVRFWGWVGLVAVLLFGWVSAARGGDDAAVRSARLAYFHGEVTISRADNTGSDPAQLNMPLLEGARVATGADGEAEVEFEDGSLLRVTPQTGVVLSRLGMGADGNFVTQISLLNGLMYAGLRVTPKYAYTVDAGADSVVPVTNATVRVMLDQPPAAVAVLDGTVHVERSAATGEAVGFSTDVRAGESLHADASGGGRYFLSQQIDHNSWDDWNEEREQAAANDAAGRTSARDAYAGDQGYGWSDLDANGTWFDTGAQGPVWQPYDASASDFDPYGYGSWVWYPAAGYVWSSGYRWGWTPFRCGSWNYLQDFGWGWSPSNGCGRGGSGFGGGGGRGVGRPTHVSRINLSNVPPGYKRPLPPTPGGPVRVHPIVPVRMGPPAVERSASFFEARRIAGQTALPLGTVEGGYTPRGGSAVGSSLRRDFPVDRATRQPVIGTLVAPPAGSRRPGIGLRPARDAGGAETGTSGARPVGSGVPGAVVVGPGRQPARGETAIRPTYRNGFEPRSASTPAPPQPANEVRPGRHGEEGAPARRDGGQTPTSVPRAAPPAGSQRSVPAPPPQAPGPVRSAPPPAAPGPARSVPAPATPPKS